MLQQTQVRTAVEYYHRWMRLFPNLARLATASLDEVLKAWEGLGYYSRARNLHRCARIVMDEYHGRFPRHPRELIRLPGIGPYTAAAIASFCFGAQVIAVDGNVRRVTARLFAFEKEVTRRDAERLLEPFYEGHPAGELNEAMMELGALRCLPSRPLCDTCPLRESCAAWQTGSVHRYPVKPEKKRAPHIHRTGYLILRDGAIFLRKRAPDEMLGGLWGIPLNGDGFPELPESGSVTLPEVKYAYTHFRVTVRPVLIRLEAKIPAAIQKAGRFVPFQEISDLALSCLDPKILGRLEAYLLERGSNFPPLDREGEGR